MILIYIKIATRVGHNSLKYWGRYQATSDNNVLERLKTAMGDAFVSVFSSADLVQ